MKIKVGDKIQARITSDVREWEVLEIYRTFSGITIKVKDNENFETEVLDTTLKYAIDSIKQEDLTEVDI